MRLAALAVLHIFTFHTFNKIRVVKLCLMGSQPIRRNRKIPVSIKNILHTVNSRSQESL